MKKIHINFVDFWNGFDKEDNDFINVLRDKYDVQLSESPEYIFYSCFGYKHLDYDCIRIFYTGECLCPDFNICDYAIGFEHMHYMDRYVRIPLYKLFRYKDIYIRALNKHNLDRLASLNQRKFCNFVYSNSSAHNVREKFFHELNTYKNVDSGGRYLNNIGTPVMDKLLFQSDYKFSIAFENCYSNGYTTEKIVDAFAACTVPIYYGNPLIAQEFNQEAFINCHKYSSFKEVIEEVRRIDSDNTLYNTMLEAPILKSERRIDGIEQLAEFLYSIFDREIEMARRRPHNKLTEQLEINNRRISTANKFFFNYTKRFGNMLRRMKDGSF